MVGFLFPDYYFTQFIIIEREVVMGMRDFTLNELMGVREEPVMKKFILEEASSGGEVNDPVEAKDWEEAASLILEQMGYKLVELKNSGEEEEKEK